MSYRKPRNFGTIKPLAPAARNLDHQLAHGLISMGPMGDCGIASVYDACRPYRPLLTGGTVYGPGLFGKGLTFPNTGSLLDLQNNFRSTDTQGSFIAWINPSTLSTHSAIFIVELVGDANQVWFFDLNNGGNAGRIRVGTYSTSLSINAQLWTANNAVVANKWSQVMVTADHNSISSGTTTAWHVYVNGQEKTLTSNGGASPSWWGNTIQSLGNLTVTVGNDPQGNIPFQGTIDHYRLYNRILGAGEAQQAYSHPFADFIPSVRRISVTPAPLPPSNLFPAFFFDTSTP